MGKHGEGTISESADGTFRIALQIRGRRRWRRARSLIEAEQKLAKLIAAPERNRTNGLRAMTRRARAIEWIGLVLDESLRRGWTRAYVSEVLAAQLAPSRIKRGVFGPCAYCGTWIAATIDHILPRERGGSDDDANLASACWTCNSRKGARTLAEWTSRPQSLADSLSGPAE